jgi:hypothetical protein
MDNKPPQPLVRVGVQLREWAIAIFIVLWLAVQIGVPLWQLSEPRPPRFGWQMFTDVKFLPQITAIRRDGSSVQLTASRYLAYFRSDFRSGYIQALAQHLCRVEPSLQAVELLRRPEGTTVRQTCAKETLQ